MNTWNRTIREEQKDFELTELLIECALEISSLSSCAPLNFFNSCLSSFYESVVSAEFLPVEEEK